MIQAILVPVSCESRVCPASPSSSWPCVPRGSRSLRGGGDAVAARWRRAAVGQDVTGAGCGGARRRGQAERGATAGPAPRGAGDGCTTCHSPSWSGSPEEAKPPLQDGSERDPMHSRQLSTAPSRLAEQRGRAGRAASRGPARSHYIPAETTSQRPCRPAPSIPAQRRMAIRRVAQPQPPAAVHRHAAGRSEAGHTHTYCLSCPLHRTASVLDPLDPLDPLQSAAAGLFRTGRRPSPARLSCHARSWSIPALGRGTLYKT